MKLLKLIILTCLLAISNVLFAQSKLTCMQGVWSDIFNEVNRFHEYSYLIVKGHKSISFSYSLEDSTSDFVIGEYVIGFADRNSLTEGVMKIKDLKQEGDYYVFVEIDNIDEDSEVVVPRSLSPEVDCEEELLSFYGNKVAEYERTFRLSCLTLKLLNNEGKIDNRSYIKEYLGINIKEVNGDSCVIYTEPDIPTKMFLNEGDIVTVLEDEGEWLKIEFLDVDLLIGWIKRSDLL